MPETAPISKLTTEQQATLEQMRKLRDQISKPFEGLPLDPDAKDLFALAQEILLPSGSLYGVANSVYTALKPPVKITERSTKPFDQHTVLQPPEPELGGFALGGSVRVEEVELLDDESSDELPDSHLDEDEGNSPST